MGVPKFYRWLSERYPCLSEVVHEGQIPEFDNLYLDMNGIIHACSHPNDEDPHFRITEEQIYKDIFRYVEVLFRLIRPGRVFFMAVDGVAPRAKMNQQRGRRFKSAKNAELLEKKARDKGEDLPTEDRFDSNCITPGTSFMARLQEQLKYFVSMKTSSDELWQGIDVYLSGHETPGEGEHKIMDFIRHQRSLPEHDPNTRHCLYGLDADLIMLGMVSHEPHFCLLREEVKFVRPQKSKQSKTVNPDQITFHLLHLHLLREYLDIEFGRLKDRLPFTYDLERIIDDWVMLSFLVGNDFIPHLPNLHIQHDALPTLYSIYCENLPRLEGYINEDGCLNLQRFEKFMMALSQFDRDKFGEDYDDFKWLEGKRKSKQENIQLRELEAFVDYDELPERLKSVAEGGLEEKVGEGSYKEALGDSNDKILEIPAQLSSALIPVSREVEDDIVEQKSNNEPEEGYESSDSNGSWTSLMEGEFRQHKRNYYREKMAYNHISKEELHSQAIEYVTAIQWNLHYYYHGVCSWSWYYPHHYAPYLSDIRGFSNMQFAFDLGTPFLPFQQLLAVLPAASAKLLPAAYLDLMTSATSPIYDFYPTDFKQDLNGKKNDWEAVVLIPFIDEKRLLEAMEKCENKLTHEERSRNVHSGHLLFKTSPTEIGSYPSSLPGAFSDIVHNRAMCEILRQDIFRIPPETLRMGLLPDAQSDDYFPGFPTFRHLSFTTELKFADVCVFQQTSRKESYVVTLKMRPELKDLTIEAVAERFLGHEVYVRWPHLTLAFVEAVSNKDERINCANKKIAHTAREKSTWIEESKASKSFFQHRRAIIIDSVEFMLHVKVLIGYKSVCDRNGNLQKEKVWTQNTRHYPLQTVVDQITVYSSICQSLNDVKVAFPIDCEVFIIDRKHSHYGYQGTLCKFENNNEVVVDILQLVEPDLSSIYNNMESLSLYYYPGWQVARKLGNINSHFVGRITGTVFMCKSKKKDMAPAMSEDQLEEKESQNINIGLNLKFNKRNEEVPDFTKKSSDGTWLYSSNLMDILKEYAEKFPEVVEYMRNSADDVLYAEDVFPENSVSRLDDLNKWLKSLPCYGLKHQTSGTTKLDERVIKAIEEKLQKTKAKYPSPTKHTLKCHVSQLFRPRLCQGNVSPDAQADFQLFDRVVNAKEGNVVPLGLHGTVVAIYPGQEEGDMQLDVLYDEEFIGGLAIRSTMKSGYKTSATSLINITFGERVRWAETDRRQYQQYNTQTTSTSRTKKVALNQRFNGSNYSAAAATVETKRSIKVVASARPSEAPAMDYKQPRSRTIPLSGSHVQSSVTNFHPTIMKHNNDSTTATRDSPRISKIAFQHGGYLIGGDHGTLRVMEKLAIEPVSHTSDQRIPQASSDSTSAKVQQPQNDFMNFFAALQRNPPDKILPSSTPSCNKPTKGGDVVQQSSKHEVHGNILDQLFPTVLENSLAASSPENSDNNRQTDSKYGKVQPGSDVASVKRKQTADALLSVLNIPKGSAPTNTYGSEKSNAAFRDLESVTLRRGLPAPQLIPCREESQWQYTVTCGSLETSGPCCSNELEAKEKACDAMKLILLMSPMGHPTRTTAPMRSPVPPQVLARSPVVPPFAVYNSGPYEPMAPPRPRFSQHPARYPNNMQLSKHQYYHSPASKSHASMNNVASVNQTVFVPLQVQKQQKPRPRKNSSAAQMSTVNTSSAPECCSTSLKADSAQVGHYNHLAAATPLSPHAGTPESLANSLSTLSVHSQPKETKGEAKKRKGRLAIKF